MVKEVVGDLLESDVPVIVHQANQKNIFGAGIAAAIKKKFPFAFDADTERFKQGLNHLGTFSLGWNPDKTAPIQLVVNMYSQEGLAPSHTNYDAMYYALSDLKKMLSKTPWKRIGVPYKIGCGLANGDWELVKAVIEKVFNNSKFEVIIYKLPEAQ